MEEELPIQEETSEISVSNLEMLTVATGLSAEEICEYLGMSAEEIDAIPTEKAQYAVSLLTEATVADDEAQEETAAVEEETAIAEEVADVVADDIPEATEEEDIPEVVEEAEEADETEEAAELMEKEVSTEGECGPNAQWSLSEDGILTITGTGAIKDFEDGAERWNGLESKITEVHIANGITRIGKNAFYECTQLVHVEIGNSVEEIGVRAFSKCTSLKSMDTTSEGGSEDPKPEETETPVEPEKTKTPEPAVTEAPITQPTAAPVHVHTPVKVAGMAAGCTTNGLTDGSKCSACGEILTAQEPIPAKGHTPTAAFGDSATSVSNGTSDYIVCAECTAVLVAPDMIPALGVYPAVTMTIGVGEKFTPVIVGGEGKTFTTSNKKIVTVSGNGQIKGKKAGTAKITVTAANGYTQVVTVKVKKAASKVTLKKTAKMGVGATMKLNAKVSGTSYQRTWTSSKPSVATVDSNGVVTAVGKGTTTITVKTFNKKKAACKITVK